MSGIGRKVTQFGVRYGDGEVEGPFTNEPDAMDWIRRCRRSIADGEWEPGDYEPMTIQRRTWHLKVSDWKPQAAPSPAPTTDAVVAASYGDDEA